MPNPKICNRIKDPAARRRCMKYKGEFAEPAGSNPGIQDQGPRPWDPPKPAPNPNWSGGFRKYMANRKKGTTY